MSGVQNIHELRLLHENAWAPSYTFFPRMIRERGFKIGIEVGVAFGGHAEAILDNSPLELLVGVDSYQHRPGYADMMNLPQEDFENLFWYAIGRLSRFGGRYAHVRTPSAEAPQHISFAADFIYLDAEHSYEAVARDIDVWSGKVRPGGVLAGHDYTPEFDGVRRAVDQFVARRGLELHIEPSAIWWVNLPA